MILVYVTDDRGSPSRGAAWPGSRLLFSGSRLRRLLSGVLLGLLLGMVFVEFASERG